MGGVEGGGGVYTQMQRQGDVPGSVVVLCWSPNLDKRRACVVRGRMSDYKLSTQIKMGIEGSRENSSPPLRNQWSWL